MKIVITSCWHLDLKLGGYDPHSDILRAARQVIDETQGADLFVHLGDLFETPKPSPRAYATAIELLNQCGCPAVVLEGNHDQDALEPLSEIEFPNEVRIIDGAQALGIGDKKFAFIPYLIDRTARELADVTAQEWVNIEFDACRRAHEDDVIGEYRIDAVFCHLDVEGAELPSGQTMFGGDLRMPVDVAKKLPVPVFNGHIHRRQKLEPNIWITGSLIPTDFGERYDEKSYVVAEI